MLGGGWVRVMHHLDTLYLYSGYIGRHEVIMKFVFFSPSIYVRMPLDVILIHRNFESCHLMKRYHNSPIVESRLTVYTLDIVDLHSQ